MNLDMSEFEIVALSFRGVMLDLFHSASLRNIYESTSHRHKQTTAMTTILNITLRCGNRPSSIYQYSNMAPRLSGQTLYLVVFPLYPSLFWELRKKETLKISKFVFRASES